MPISWLITKVCDDFFMCKREKRKEKVQCTRHQGPGTRGLDSRISASSAMRNLGSHFNATGFGDISLHAGSRICPVNTFPMHYI